MARTIFIDITYQHRNFVENLQVEDVQLCKKDKIALQYWLADICGSTAVTDTEILNLFIAWAWNRKNVNYTSYSGNPV